jgi:glycine/D-amino acid oxidase-like deaminating enzyme
MTKLNRRSLLLAGAGAAAAAALPRGLGARPGGPHADTIVIGAGVFGAWTAWRLRAAGRRVMLVDAWGPAHARASSGGESRMTRGSYGADEVYTRMALDSLEEWRSLSAHSGLPIFHRTGVLFFFPRIEPFLEETMRVHRRLGLPTELLDQAAMRRRWRQIDFHGIVAGLHEPGFGALMARRAVQQLVSDFVARGGDYRHARIAPPAATRRGLSYVVTGDGDRLTARNFVFACGPWLGRLFPDLLGRRIFPTRQEVFFFAPPAGNRDYEIGRLAGDPAALPGWADFNGGDIYYGFPSLEGRGFKIAHDAHGPPMDPDTGDRTPSPGALADVRAFMARRFPALANRPLSEARVCQYENSSNGDLLIDRHPTLENVVLVGAGSGHGFKHGPAVGRYAADLVMGRLAAPEPRFSLATKAEQEARAVH